MSTPATVDAFAQPLRTGFKLQQQGNTRCALDYLPHAMGLLLPSRHCDIVLHVRINAYLRIHTYPPYPRYQSATLHCRRLPAAVPASVEGTDPIDTDTSGCPATTRHPYTRQSARWVGSTTSLLRLSTKLLGAQGTQVFRCGHAPPHIEAFNPILLVHTAQHTNLKNPILLTVNLTILWSKPLFVCTHASSYRGQSRVC